MCVVEMGCDAVRVSGEDSTASSGTLFTLSATGDPISAAKRLCV